MNKPTVLLIDDDPDYLEIVSLYLSAKYDVRTASSVREALAVMDADDPDLVLLDLMMPLLSGLDFVERLRAEQPRRADTPVVALTAASLGRLRPDVAAKVDGLAGFIEKPYELSILAQRVGEIFARLCPTTRFPRWASL